MSLLIAVIVGGLVVGYWLVSLFLSTRPDDNETSAPEQDHGDSAAHDAPHRPWHVVLDVSRHADATEISAAYRRALAQYDARHMETLAPELQVLARERTAEIEAAYLEALHSLRR